MNVCNGFFQSQTREPPIWCCPFHRVLNSIWNFLQNGERTFSIFIWNFLRFYSTINTSDYDARIDKAEKQIKEWKAQRRKLATKEAKAAQREAERQRDEDLRNKGIQYEDIEQWMKSNTITISGSSMTIWEWYHRGKRQTENNPEDYFRNGEPR